MNRTASRRLAALQGLISPEVGERLYQLAREVPADQAIVEIGSFKGKSSCYLGEGSRDGNRAPVHCIEPWDLPGNVYGKHGYSDPAVFETWQRQVEAMGLTDIVTPHKAFSHEFAEHWNKPIGLLFIDGSHAYEDVKRDYYAYERFVQTPGVVAFDDYGRANPGVVKLVDQIVWYVKDFSTPPLAILRIVE